MLKTTATVSNPLTVISIFAAITEVGGTAVLPFLSPANQGLYVYFLMGFPILLVGLFFVTLNFNHKVLYAPGDYREDSSFLEASKSSIRLNEVRPDASVQIEVAGQPF